MYIICISNLNIFSSPKTGTDEEDREGEEDEAG